MGSSNEKQKGNKNQMNYGGIFVKTEKFIYYPGDNVNGFIYLNIISPYPGNTISLQFKGKQ